MNRRNIIMLVLIGGMFLIAGLLILLAYFPHGTYEIEKGQIKISVSITENTYGFVDTEYTKKITVQDGESEYHFDFWSVELKFKVIKRKRNGKEFWLVDDYMRGMAEVKNGTLDDFTCSDCTGSEAFTGEDLMIFEFDKFEWSCTTNSL